LRIAEITFEIIAEPVYNTDVYVKKAHPLTSCKLVNVPQHTYFTGFYEDEQVKYCCKALIYRKLRNYKTYVKTFLKNS